MVSAGDLIIISDLAGNISVYNSRKQSFQKNLLKTHANILDIQPFKIQNQDRFLILTDAECHIQDACLLVFDPKKPEQKLNTLKLPSKAKPKKIMIGQANADRLDDLFILAEDNSIYLSLGQTNNFQRVVKIGSAKRQIPANGLDLSQHIYFEKNNQAPKIPNPILPITGLNQFQGSFFKYKDANGGYLADQDLISLSIQLNNRTDSRNNFQISIPTYLQPFDLPANITVKNRKINLSLNPNQSRTLRLTARYDFGSDQAPRVFLVQNTQSPVADNLSDVQISLDTDSIIFYNSNLNRNRISYQRQILNSPAPNLEAEPEEAPVLGQLESLLKAESEEDKKEAAHQSLILMANSDGDGDGFPDMYDSATNKLSNTAKSIEKAIKKYQCSGGCLAIPVNQSFLTPLTPADPGFPILGISLVTPWVTSGPSAALMPLHFYLSPTLTGELYTAVCAGVYPASWCLPFKVADLGNLCKKINQKLMKLMSKGVDIAASKINEYSGSVISLGASETNLPRPNTGIIGFPELFTDWLANQYAELVRFIDLPDITLVYPRVETLFTRVPSSKTEEQFRKSAGVNEETANVFSLCPRFQPYTDLCGNVGTPAEFEAMKKENNIHYNLQNYAKSLEQEFSDLPILNIRPVPTKISYPMVSQSELYRFLGTALKTRDKLIISFLNALDDWRCMESDRQHQSDIMYQKLVQGDASAYKQKVSTEYKNTVSENPDAPKPTFVDTKFLKDDESFFEFLFDALISGRMATFMAAKQDPSKVKGKACIDLAIGFEGILGNLDKNMRIIQSYRDIPLHIFEIQNFLAVYAGNILDYGITILEGVNGWLVRQVDALGKWLAMVEDLLKLLDSFKLIMNLFVDFQNSCDTCRSDRTNLGLNMIINLVFQAVPDIPVIRLPKLPNLTLDVSELVAGFTVDLPELKFDPNYLKLPDIDLSIELPKAPPIGLRAQLKGFEMPLLPEVPDFKALIDFPEIPPLEFPRLPDLPDPPEVGKIGFEFEAKFGAAIDFLTQALRLYCLYLKGITGVPGPLLKTQIETMSNRPLSPVLPIDKLFAIQMPSLTGEYLAEHQYILTSDLRYGFPQVAELTKAFTDQLDEFSIEIKNYFQDFLDSLSKFTTIKIEAFKSLEELDLQKDITVDPEKEVQPGLQSYHIQVLPQATQAKTLRHDLDIASLEKRLQQLPYSLSKQLAPVYLAATGQSYEFQPAPGNLVADTSTQPKPPAALESRTIQLAALADGPIDPRENADFVTPNRGIKIQNDLNQVQDVMNYNLNDIQGSRVTLHDVDQDRDPDLMFNLEQDIFIKRNQDKAHNSRQTASIQEVQFDSFQDSIPSSLSLEKQSLSFTDSVGQTQISLSENLQDQILILDVYEADFSSPKAYMRYVINPLEDISKPQVLQSYQFGQEIQIAKQQFQNIVLLPPGSGQLSLSLLNNPYLVLPSYYNLASQSLEVLDTYQAINPSECYDRVPPSIQVNQNELGKLGLYQRATIDLSQSQDLETEIVKLYLDTDPEVDSDLDSNPQNDVNLIGSQNPTASKFRIGPFNSEHESRYIIHAVDKVGNRAQKQVNISVAIPEIKLESASASQVQGQVTPKFEDAPIEIIRKRNGQNQIIGNLTTDEQGRFTLNTPNPGVGLAQTLSIIDSQQQEHFRINKQTGTVMAMTPQARIQVQPAQPDQHTEIQLYHGQNRLSTLQRIGITEQDVQLLNQSPSQQELAQLQATSVWDLQPKDQIQAEILAPSNESFYGGLAIKEGENILATVDKDGAIQLKSNALSLKLEEVAHIDQAQSYEIYHKQTLIFKAFVPTSDSELALKQDSFTVRQLIPEPTEAASAPEPSPAPTPTSAPSPAPEQLLDLEETNPNYEAITYLLEQGVFSGVQTERGLEFQSERLINRAEYAKVILKILCIEPSKPAYLPPAVFSDIPHTNQDLIWYYPITKESFLQNFFEGYLGEKDPQTQLSPFKPANNITRIEAAKVIMEALNTQGSIDISEIPYLTPWYKAFLAASQDLRSYLTEPDGQSKKLFLITEAEAQLAEKFLTRGEFAQMAYRALQIHNCLAKQPQDEQESPEISDSQTTNQLSNQEKSPQEPSQTPSPPAAEASQDQVGDQAGAKEPYQPPKPAINLEEVSCNSCPCRYTIKDNQSLSAKDEVFAILRNQDRSQVLNISNSLQLEKDS